MDGCSMDSVPFYYARIHATLAMVKAAKRAGSGGYPLVRLKLLMIREGDIVNFFTTVAMWQDEYANRNPGIVLSVSRKNPITGVRGATILWVDGGVTTEHASYLSMATSESQSEKT